jgi:hypothetical protein
LTPEEENKRLRFLLFQQLMWQGEGNYYDDGEMQLYTPTGHIDFKRMSIAEIEKQLNDWKTHNLKDEKLIKDFAKEFETLRKKRPT